MVFQQKQDESRMNLEWISSFSVMPEMSPLGVFFWASLFFCQEGNVTPVTPIHTYRKYHISTRFLMKIIFHFPPKKKNSYFLEKRNTIFPDITKKIMFRREFFGKTIFSKHLEKENMVFRAVRLQCYNWWPNFFWPVS